MTCGQQLDCLAPSATGLAPITDPTILIPLMDHQDSSSKTFFVHFFSDSVLIIELFISLSLLREVVLV
jgi:hypothetical protein